MNQFLLSWISRLRRLLLWLWQQEGTAAQRARGLAVGVFSGCFPLFGLQTVFGIVLARIFRGNHLLAVVGTWISNPITYLPLFWLNYKVGCQFLGQELNVHELVNLDIREVWTQSWIFIGGLFFGSFLVGLLCGCVTGMTIYIFLRRVPRSKNLKNE